MMERFQKQNDYQNEIMIQDTSSEKEIVLLWKEAINRDIRNENRECISQLLCQGKCLPDDIRSILELERIFQVGREDILQLILEGIFVDMIVAKEDILGEKILLFADFWQTVKISIRIDNQNVMVYEFVCHTEIRPNNKCVEWMRKRLASVGICCFYQQKRDKTGYNLCFFYSADSKAILWYYQPSSKYYEITTTEVRKCIEQWNQKYGVEILGAGSDWVELRFLNLYRELKEFQWEATRFCPQLVLPKDFTNACIVKEDNQVEILFSWK
jgi:hypothetical protein